MITKKNIVFIVLLLITNICNIVYLSINSPVRDCERILKESKKNFDLQYSKLVQVVISNNVNSIKYDIELKTIKNQIASNINTSIIRQINNKLTTSKKEESTKKITSLDYDYVIVDNNHFIAMNGLIFSEGDYLPEGKILFISQNYITLDNGNIITRSGRTVKRQLSPVRPSYDDDNM